MSGEAPVDFGTYEKGRKISAKGLNNMAGRLTELTPIIGGDGIAPISLPGGTGLIRGQTDPEDRPRIGAAVIPAIVTSAVDGRIGVYKGKRRKMIVAKATGDLDEQMVGEPEAHEDLLIYNTPEAYGGDPLDLPMPGWVQVGYRTEGGFLVCSLISGGAGGGLGLGLYQGQVPQMLSDLVGGWDFLTLHSP